MARTQKTTKPRTTPVSAAKPATAQELIKQPATVVGAIVLTIAVLIAASAVANNIPGRRKGAGQETPQASLLSPMPSTTMITPEPTKVANQEMLQNIKELAYTSSEQSVKIIEGDSFWKIAARVCGKGKLAESIRMQNGYGPKQKLQIGNTVTVSCE